MWPRSQTHFLGGALREPATLPSQPSATRDARAPINVTSERRAFSSFGFSKDNVVIQPRSQQPLPYPSHTQRPPEEPKLATAAVPLLSDTGRETSHDMHGGVSKGKVIGSSAPSLLWHRAGRKKALCPESDHKSERCPLYC